MTKYRLIRPRDSGWKLYLQSNTGFCGKWRTIYKTDYVDNAERYLEQEKDLNSKMKNFNSEYQKKG